MPLEKQKFAMDANAWLISTITMSSERKGVYIDLLCYQWTEGGMSLSDAMKFSIARGHAPATAFSILMDKFDEVDPGSFQNLRLEQERGIDFRTDFTPPTEEEVAEHIEFLKRSNPSSFKENFKALWYVSKYEAQDWKTGSGVPIANWKQHVKSVMISWQGKSQIKLTAKDLYDQ